MQRSRYCRPGWPLHGNAQAIPFSLLLPMLYKASNGHRADSIQPSPGGKAMRNILTIVFFAVPLLALSFAASAADNISLFSFIAQISHANSKSKCNCQ